MTDNDRHLVTLTRSGGWGVACWTCPFRAKSKGWLKADAKAVAEAHADPKYRALSQEA